jgi:aspartyl-tRNA(Asn)/glutamyl-tRNA(Gln) amidotransferase subunit A
MIDITQLTIEIAHDALKKKQFTVRELVDTYLSEAKKRNPDVFAYLEFYTDIDEQVDRAQALFDAGAATLMTGIPLAVKDNMLIEGKSVTAGSKILEGYHATYTSSAVKLLIDAGAVLIGRTNMDEFAMGSSTETSAYGITKNPLDLSRVPGGSSGGSAAAVAMHGALASLGSDTGGSIRQPAAFCGLVGLKPTYGAVSRYGLIAMGSSLDQIGPFAKTVRDVEIIHEIISQHDTYDATSVPLENRVTISPIVKKIGIPEGLLDQGADPSVAQDFSHTYEVLRGMGYELVPVSLPYMPYSLAVYYILMPAESSTNLSRFDGVRYGPRIEKDSLLETYLSSRGEGFGREVRRRILLGTYVLSHGYYDAYYGKALKVREAIRKEFEEVFRHVDVILTPTTPGGAFRFGEKIDDPVAMYLCDVFAVPANIAGIPAISVPSGKDENSMPLGIQFMAPWWGEDRLFTISKAWESRQ